MTAPSFSILLLSRWRRAPGARHCAAALLLAGCTGSLGAQLSYLFWNTMPSDERLAAAKAGELSTPEAVRAYAEGMLDGRRAREVVGAFQRQLYDDEQCHDLDKDQALYPEFVPEMGDEMQREAELFVEHVLFDDKYPSFRKVPYILAGGAAGYLKTGQFVDVTITNNKLLDTDTIGAAVGCTNSQGGPLDDFGDESLEGGLVDPIIA
ncbi:DUF1592 domain-containing protein [Sorangium sp. So ce1000]|uniref:DUF1592 domain-containing protein n=1 Tax=Sorangium sp. So ce1000 TaxID=3133325 RepID=UPI003F5E54CA